jgi:hypothetical protein
VAAEVVVELVSASPEVAVELADGSAVTSPLVPPAPELPLVAEGVVEALPESVVPVDPVSPLVAVEVGLPLKESDEVEADPEEPESPESPEAPEAA